MTASASVVVPVGLLNEAAGLLELEGYGPVSMGLLSCLNQPADQDAREAVARVEAALVSIDRIFPVHVTETPDYAELAFNECGAQAMTVEPDTWTALNNLSADLRTILALTQAAPDGWRLVPVEPTHEMIEAGYQPWLNRGKRKGPSVVRGVYLAMLSASPAPPAQGAGG